MTPINRVSIRRGVVCRVVTPTLLLTALFAGSSPLHAAKKSEPADKDRVPEGVSAADWQSIRAAHEAWQHAIEPVKGGWQARNPAQQWTTKFDGRGFEAKPQSADWTWGLELRSYGAGDEQREVNGTPEVKTEGHRLAYHWDDTVQEWFVNDGRGLEHGFSVQERPPGPSDAPLTFVLATRGPLRAAVTGNARAVDYRDQSGATVLTYSGLRVWDADRRELEARFAPAKDGVTLQVDAKNARYPLLIDPIAQQAYLKASNTGATDQFGTAVAISGDIMVVGAPREDTITKDAGAAYIFQRNGRDQWNFIQMLTPSSDSPPTFKYTWQETRFGESVATDGSLVVVGAPFDSSNGKGVNPTPDQFSNVANSGAVYVFGRNAEGLWTRQAYLKANDAKMNDRFGLSVDVSSNTVIVGTGFGKDSAYIFVRSPQRVWSQQTVLESPSSGGAFGESVAISGDTAVVADPIYGSEEGAVYVFVRSGTTWSQQAQLKASNIGVSDYFGFSVAISDGTAPLNFLDQLVVVGAPGEDSSSTGINSTPNNSAQNAGAVYVFERARNNANFELIPDQWQQKAYLKASNAGTDDFFGTSVAISSDGSYVGKTVVVGATGEDSTGQGWPDAASQNSNSFPSAGAAYVFQRKSGVPGWEQQAYLKAWNAGTGDYFGDSVAISGETAVVGAPIEDSSATGVNDLRDNELATDSGAAYLFTGLGPPPVITSPTTASGQVGSSFNYQLTATAVAEVDSYNATGLPAGLSIDTATGAITGTPGLEGTYNVSVSATNAGGTGTAAIALEIAADADSLKMLPPKRTVTAGKPAKLVLLFGNNLTRTQKVKVNFSSSNPGLLAAPASFSFDALGKKNAKAKAKAQRRTITIPIPAATAAGTVKITATVGDQSASCDLTIKAAK